jgi:hypothetical protein
MGEISIKDTTMFSSEDDGLYNKKTVPVPKPKPNIGVDVEGKFLDNIIEGGLAEKLDYSEITSFSTASQSRDQIYQLLDTMSEDSIISSVLESYAEDATGRNDQGRIVWCESSDADINNYITFLLDTLNVDKNVYSWVYNLCKYGDVYLKLYRESEYDDPVFGSKDEKKDDNTLNEDININVYKKSDKYAHYVEMVPNPAEVFELIKFGKTCGYIKSPVISNSTRRDNLNNVWYKYTFKKDDIDIYNATEFVHGALVDSSNRTPEEVNIFMDDEKSGTYTVRRGKSILYNTFKIWRELQLLENSVLLNRITKSSIVRAINVQVGDMDKAQVNAHLHHIKAMIEQKASIDKGNSMSEYTNPGPIENNIYIPVKGEVGNISVSQIGGDVDVKSLADLDYFKNKFYGNLRVPKQFFGDTDDGAGFNGGESLAQISSRYAKMTKRVQAVTCEMITDIINLYLLDKGLDSYINKFTIKMLAPVTVEDTQKRDNMSTQLSIISDVMALVTDMESTADKFKILKSLLSNVITDPEVIDIIQSTIDKLELSEQDLLGDGVDGSGMDDDFGGEDDFGGDVGLGGGGSMSDMGDSDDMGDESDSMDLNSMLSADTELPLDSGDSDEILPSPSELGVDMTDEV